MLLATPLRAVLGHVCRAFRARIVRNELLAEFFIFSVVVVRVLDAALVLPNLLQRALVVLARADMNESVVWRLRDDLGVDCADVHHVRVVEAA